MAILTAAPSKSGLSLATRIGLAFIASLFVMSCNSRKKDTDTVSTTPLTSEGGVDSTPMSFDATGSDSGKIDGLVTVHFGYDKANLDSGAKNDIKTNAEWMKRNASAKVQIEGHCDSRGSIEYNLALGERRAKAVRDYLVSSGVPASRVSTISYGKERPLDPSENEAAWAKNRRANFVPSGQ
ncbi:MAG: peptidoglycan-associated lipoprotein Pal [Bdellovibrionota bacterium]